METLEVPHPLAVIVVTGRGRAGLSGVRDLCLRDLVRERVRTRSAVAVNSKPATTVRQGLLPGSEDCGGHLVLFTEGVVLTLLPVGIIKNLPARYDHAASLIRAESLLYRVVPRVTNRATSAGSLLRPSVSRMKRTNVKINEWQTIVRVQLAYAIERLVFRRTPRSREKFLPLVLLLFRSECVFDA